MFEIISKTLTTNSFLVSLVRFFTILIALTFTSISKPNGSCSGYQIINVQNKLLHTSINSPISFRWFIASVSPGDDKLQTETELWIPRKTMEILSNEEKKIHQPQTNIKVTSFDILSFHFVYFNVSGIRICFSTLTSQILRKLDLPASPRF